MSRSHTSSSMCPSHPWVDTTPRALQPCPTLNFILGKCALLFAPEAELLPPISTLALLRLTALGEGATMFAGQRRERMHGDGGGGSQLSERGRGSKARDTPFARRSFNNFLTHLIIFAIFGSIVLPQNTPAMHAPLSFALFSCAGLVLAAPYPPTSNVPLHSLYHYCSPPAGLSTPYSTASSLTPSFCTTAASEYRPNAYGEVEILQDDRLFLRAWWDASEARRSDFEAECKEAVERIVRGCRHEGSEEKFYGGVSEFAKIGGKVEVGFET
ncbi:hypothetical protein K458DRAFT_407873 [Lentithecium fluviatile CBS 122367]|uniref:Uncharacterized protein n=1 Tax=Lentithecium fluviatile CBS 122367 TaxID=1168545 RepID=A0A6G1IP57_9PLEO|nr:hypothetical protein K458DRAFT_407873 [Lentithecium fluviatile CBS 122367]